MVKAIVRINAFLDKKQMGETYNFIYGQLKSGSEVIIVPNYCDVYILDGADVEVQKKDNIHLSENKSCSTCKYVDRGDCFPCTECSSNSINVSGYDKWEAKDND